jgi:hypothetical protein
MILQRVKFVACRCGSYCEWLWFPSIFNLISVCSLFILFRLFHIYQADVVFHLMKRPRPAAKHSFLDVYGECLSYAFFVRNTKDEAAVRRAWVRRKFSPMEVRNAILHDHGYTQQGQARKGTRAAKKRHKGRQRTTQI